MINKNKMEYILTDKVRLFRYDLVQPPKAFSNEFKNPQYEGFGHNLGPKNVANLFFFFNGRETAMRVGNNAVASNTNYNALWLTEAKTICDLRLLDIRNVSSVANLYVTLLNNEIDIFIPNFYKIMDPTTRVPMSTIRDKVFEYWKLTKQNVEKSNAKFKRIRTLYSEIENFFYPLLGVNRQNYACQQLTDFGNGKIFKEILLKKKYQGLIFNENAKEPNSDTVCLFDSSILQIVSCEKIK